MLRIPFLDDVVKQHLFGLYFNIGLIKGGGLYENARTSNCSRCVYVEREAQGMWCPFHDEAVSEKLVCDYYVDEYAAPLYASLADEGAKVGTGVIVKDIIGYTLIGGLIILNIIVVLGLILS